MASRSMRLATMTIIVAACAPAGSVDVSPPGVPAPTPMRFDSTIYPYQLLLPLGWSVTRYSQVPGSDEDVFSPASGEWWILVASGIPEPGQTLEDRVDLGREQLPECASHAADDVAISMGGERGILWRAVCPDGVRLAAQTIHDGVGYRLTLGGLAREAIAEGEITMAEVLAGFEFTE
jgi:hypothetical protein